MMWSAIIDILTALKDGDFGNAANLLDLHDGDSKVLAWLPFHQMSFLLRY